MDDLNKLSESRKEDRGIIIKDAEEPRKAPVAVASNHKMVYFIGFLIVLIVALSAFSMTVSLKALSRVENVEEITAATNAKILARLKNSETVSASLVEILKKQGGETRALQALVAARNEEGLARIDSLKDQIGGLRGAVKEKEYEIEEMTTAQGSLRTLLEDSVDDLKAADRLMLEKYVLLKGKVEKMAEQNAYLYGAY